jgi:PhnB protein
MAERLLTDRLDETVDAILRRGDATGALRDPELAPLARVAADLRHYPSPDFKTRLRAQLERQLERKLTMTTVSTTPAVREGFTTVTPYIRVAQEGLVDFLARVFDAQETFSGGGGGGGMHREVRIGDSMLMIGEGGASAGGVMPVRPVAFHVFVKDVDATFERAVAAGAEPIGKPEDRHYGERSGFVRDRFGNHWYIATALGPQSLASALRTVTPALHVERAEEYVEFLKRALGAVDEMRAAGPAGELRYGRLRIGDAAIELSGEGVPMPGSFMLYVADPDALYHQAISAGATSIMPLGDQPYGRVGGVQDAAGNQWFFSRPASPSS